MNSPFSRHRLKFATRLLLLTLAACAPAMSPPGGTSASAPTGPFELVVLSTTDAHGWIRGHDYYGDSAQSLRGLTRAATIVDSVRAANQGRVLLLDAGDLLQGNPFAYVAMKQFADSANPIVAAMNTMRYDAMAIGNHEYNYGVPYLERAAKQARFPMLSANTYRPDGKHKFRPWTIIERQGVRIGIIGATTPGVMVWDAENVRGRVRLDAIVPAVRAAVEEVKAAGASVVIVTMHSGLNEPASYDTASTGLPGENVAGRVAADVPGVDLIVYGHSHREQKGLMIGATLLVQPKNWATSVGVAHLTISADGRVTASRGETIQTVGRAENPAVVAVSNATHRATVTYVNTVIGNTPVAWRGDSARLRDSPLIDLINEVQLKATGADLSASAAFSLDASLDAGPITVAEMARLYPYDNTLRAIRISGRQLRDYLEFSARFYAGLQGGMPTSDPGIPGYNFDMISGADYTIDLTRPIGSRITSLAVKGRSVAPADTFTLAVNNYRQTGGGGYAMIQRAPVVYDKQQEIRQLLIDEVQRRGTIRPDDYFRRNWTLAYPGAGTAAAGSGAGLPPGAPRLRIIATNDFHGALEPRHDANGVQRGGAAYVATMIEQAKNECAPACETILLDGGDLFQGTLASNLAFGRPVVDYYNRMGYAAAAVGNHEFDWGRDTLRARMRGAKFALLGANVRLTDGHDAEWIRDDTIVVRGATRIGVIGIASKLTPRTSLPQNISGLRFDDAAPVIDARARSLRSRGAQAIIVVAHDGGFCNMSSGAETCSGEIFEIAGRITEKVDAIVSGHTHSRIDKSVNGIPIVQARSSGQAIAVLDIPLEDGKPIGGAVVEVRSVVTADIAPLPAVDSIVRRAAAAVAPIVNRRIASIGTALTRTGNQYPLGNLIADAHRVAGKGDIAVTNNGGIRTGLSAGDITYGSLYEIQPFGTRLYTVRMTGAQVREYLERLVGRENLREHVSGVTVGYNPELPKGKRIVSLRMPAGRTLVDGAVYNVILNEFMATGGEGRTIPAGASMTPLRITDLDALISYLRALRSPVTAPADTRIFITQ